MIACIQRPSFPSSTKVVVGLCGISVPFGTLSHSLGKVSYVLLTRTPRYRGRIPFAFDLHVLGPPLTFALSQDQTLQLNFRCIRRNSINRERLPEPLNQFVENWLHLHGYELVARNHTRPLRVREFHSRDNVSQCLVITDSPIQFSRTVYGVQNTEVVLQSSLRFAFLSVSGGAFYSFLCGGQELSSFSTQLLVFSPASKSSSSAGGDY